MCLRTFLPLRTALSYSTFGDGACPVEPGGSGGEASEILRRCAPQNDMLSGFLGYKAYLSHPARGEEAPGHYLNYSCGMYSGAPRGRHQSAPTFPSVDMTQFWLYPDCLPCYY